GLITIDGQDVGTVSTITADTLTLLNLQPAFLTTGGGVHAVVQRNRLGEKADFFVFPIAQPDAHAGNGVIDAPLLFAGIPNGQLPAVGFTAYGGAGNDLIIGSQAGDHLAGGSGDDTILGQRGVDHLYGDSGFNVDFIKRALTVATAPGLTTTANMDNLTAGKDLLYGESPGSTATDACGDDDDVI